MKIMGKIRIRTGRGTGTMEVDDNPARWSGDEFRKIQAIRKKAAANRMVHTEQRTSDHGDLCHHDDPGFGLDDSRQERVCKKPE